MKNTRIREINEEIEKTTEEGLRVFDVEFSKFTKRSTELIKAFADESIKVKKGIALAIKELEKVEKEILSVRAEYEATKVKIGTINKKEDELAKREDELVQLHGTLDRKSKRLDAKEKELALADSKTGTPLKN